MDRMAFQAVVQADGKNYLAEQRRRCQNCPHRLSPPDPNINFVLTFSFVSPLPAFDYGLKLYRLYICTLPCCVVP